MRRQVKAALVSLGGGAVVAALFAAATVAVGQTADIPKGPEFRSTSCTTNSSGVCTVSHSLGVVPSTVIVSANTPGANNGFTLNTVRDSFTATTFKVRAMTNATTPKANGTIWFSYAAYAAGVTPPPPPPSTTTPVPPPPSTTTPVPPPTTTPVPPPAGTCPGGAKPTLFAEQDGGDFPVPAGEGDAAAASNSYFVHNNAWNWQGAGSGQTEKLYACSASNWWTDVYGFKPSNGEVFMYPNVHLDVNGMNGRPLSTWQTVGGRWANVNPAGGSWNAAWDLWLNGVADKNSFELMVWTDKHGAAEPAGTQRPSFTDPSTGQIYDVYWDGTHNDQAYLAFISQKAQPSGTVDLRAFIAEAQKRGYLPAGDTSVNQVDYGVEIRDTQGATAAAPYRYTLTDFGLTMK